jgi:hypothetical protein
MRMDLEDLNATGIRSVELLSPESWVVRILSNSHAK